MAYSTKGNPHRELPYEKKKRVKKDGTAVQPVVETLVVDVPVDTESAPEVPVEASEGIVEEV